MASILLTISLLESFSLIPHIPAAVLENLHPQGIPPPPSSHLLSCSPSCYSVAILALAWPTLSPFPLCKASSFSAVSPCCQWGVKAAPAPSPACPAAEWPSSSRHCELPCNGAGEALALWHKPDVPRHQVRWNTLLTGWWHGVWSLCIACSTGGSTLTIKSWHIPPSGTLRGPLLGVHPADPLYLPNAPNHAIQTTVKMLIHFHRSRVLFHKTIKLTQWEFLLPKCNSNRSKASLVSFPPSTHLPCYNWGKGVHVLLFGE